MGQQGAPSVPEGISQLHEDEDDQSCTHDEDQLSAFASTHKLLGHIDAQSTRTVGGSRWEAGRPRQSPGWRLTGGSAAGDLGEDVLQQLFIWDVLSGIRSSS